jgi:acyl-coenzyme A synthetase/AMP-(fatty) acid ligase
MQPADILRRDFATISLSSLPRNEAGKILKRELRGALA